MRDFMQKIDSRMTVIEKGMLPAQPLPNPKPQYEISDPSSSNQMGHAKSITTLRSGKIIDKTIPVKAEKP
ncbi:hypothetical protein PJP07_29730, partial [Mycobacterium kansasii]